MEVYLANVSVDTNKQNNDAYATVYEYNSNDFPTGTGATTPAFTPSFILAFRRVRSKQSASIRCVSGLCPAEWCKKWLPSSARKLAE